MWTRELIVRQVWNKVFVLRVKSEKVYQMFGQVWNRVEKIADFGLKQEKGFRKRPAHSFPIILGVSLGDKLLFIIFFFVTQKWLQHIFTLETKILTLGYHISQTNEG